MLQRYYPTGMWNFWTMASFILLKKKCQERILTFWKSENWNGLEWVTSRQKSKIFPVVDNKKMKPWLLTKLIIPTKLVLKLMSRYNSPQIIEWSQFETQASKQYVNSMIQLHMPNMQKLNNIMAKGKRNRNTKRKRK